VARRLPKAQRRRQRKRLKVVEAQSFNTGVFVFREKVDAERLNGVLVFILIVCKACISFYLNVVSSTAQSWIGEHMWNP